MSRRAPDILRAYLTPGHPTAFSGVTNVSRFHKISPGQARAILDTLETYATHREYKRPAVFNPYYIRRRRDFIQADLIDVREARRQNGGTGYLLLIIDLFSRFVWVYPLKRKTGPLVRDALAVWLGECGDPPRVFSTDLGKEFFNASVRQLLADAGVEHQKALGTKKAAVAERANKTIQILMAKYMTENKTKRYIDVLPSLVKTYNTRPHRTLKGMTPKEADSEENVARVLAIHDARYKAVPRSRPAFKLGDIVRVKTESKILTPSSRSYKPQFNKEYYYVHRINNKLKVPMYHLKAAADDEDIEGGFYSNELTRVAGDVWRIEEIVERRGRGRRAQVKVKWEGFSQAWNTWLPAASLQPAR